MHIKFVIHRVQHDVESCKHAQPENSHGILRAAQYNAQYMYQWIRIGVSCATPCVPLAPPEQVKSVDAMT